MKWSWKIARLADIDVYVHATFFILIAWIGLSIWQQQANIPAVINGIGFILSCSCASYCTNSAMR